MADRCCISDRRNLETRTLIKTVNEPRDREDTTDEDKGQEGVLGAPALDK